MKGNMKPETGDERCSVCNCELRKKGQKGYEPLTFPERDKEIVLRHCPNCGTLLIHIETIPALSR